MGYFEGEDVAYVWRASSLPRLKKGEMSSEPDERANGHSTGIYHRIRSNPNMTESSIGWGRFAVLLLALAYGGSECASLAKDVSVVASTRSRASVTRLSDVGGGKTAQRQAAGPPVDCVQ